MEFKHTSILLKESVAFLITDKNGIYVDCTLGGGGHMNMAGAKISNKSIDEVLIDLKDVIKKYLRVGE